MTGASADGAGAAIVRFNHSCVAGGWGCMCVGRDFCSMASVLNQLLLVLVFDALDSRRRCGDQLYEADSRAGVRTRLLLTPLGPGSCG